MLRARGMHRERLKGAPRTSEDRAAPSHGWSGAAAVALCAAAPRAYAPWGSVASVSCSTRFTTAMPHALSETPQIARGDGGAAPARALGTRRSCMAFTRRPEAFLGDEVLQRSSLRHLVVHFCRAVPQEVRPSKILFAYKHLYLWKRLPTAAQQSQRTRAALDVTAVFAECFAVLNRAHAERLAARMFADVACTTAPPAAAAAAGAPSVPEFLSMVAERSAPQVRLALEQSWIHAQETVRECLVKMAEFVAVRNLGTETAARQPLHGERGFSPIPPVPRPLSPAPPATLPPVETYMRFAHDFAAARADVEAVGATPRPESALDPLLRVILAAPAGAGVCVPEPVEFLRVCAWAHILAENASCLLHRHFGVLMDSGSEFRPQGTTRRCRHGGRLPDTFAGDSNFVLCERAENFDLYPVEETPSPSLDALRQLALLFTHGWRTIAAACHSAREAWDACAERLLHMRGLHKLLSAEEHQALRTAWIMLWERLRLTLADGAGGEAGGGADGEAGGGADGEAGGGADGEAGGGADGEAGGGADGEAGGGAAGRRVDPLSQAETGALGVELKFTLRFCLAKQLEGTAVGPATTAAKKTAPAKVALSMLECDESLIAATPSSSSKWRPPREPKWQPARQTPDAGSGLRAFAGAARHVDLCPRDAKRQKRAASDVPAHSDSQVDAGQIPAFALRRDNLFLQPQEMNHGLPMATPSVFPLLEPSRLPATHSSPTSDGHRKSGEAPSTLNQQASPSGPHTLSQTFSNSKLVAKPAPPAQFPPVRQLNASYDSSLDAYL